MSVPAVLWSEIVVILWSCIFYGGPYHIVHILDVTQHTWCDHNFSSREYTEHRNCAFDECNSYMTYDAVPFLLTLLQCNNTHFPHCWFAYNPILKWNPFHHTQRLLMSDNKICSAFFTVIYYVYRYDIWANVRKGNPVLYMLYRMYMPTISSQCFFTLFIRHTAIPLHSSVPRCLTHLNYHPFPVPHALKPTYIFCTWWRTILAVLSVGTRLFQRQCDMAHAVPFPFSICNTHNYFSSLPYVVKFQIFYTVHSRFLRCTLLTRFPLYHTQTFLT